MQVWAAGLLVEVAAAVTLITAGLLLPAGVAKLRDAAVARRASAWPSRTDPWLRLLGSVEVVLAGAVLLVGGVVPAAALGVGYLGFLVVAATQRRRGSGCACFGAGGAEGAAVTTWHLTVNAVAAVAAAVTAAAGGTRPVLHHLGADPVAGLAGLLLLAVGVAALHASLTLLPALRAARRLEARP